MTSSADENALLARVQTLRDERRHSSADALADAVTSLAEGAPISHPLAAAEAVRGDEALGLLASAAKAALGDVRTVGASITAHCLLFALEDRDLSDPAVRETAQHQIERVIAERGRGVQSREKHFNVHDARDALLACRRIFETAGRRFFLDRGTLLGCIRENGFIANDYDIDLGIFEDEITLDEVKALFEPTDFTLTQDFEYKVGVESPAGIQIDFFLTTRHHGYFLSMGFRSVHNWYFRPFDLVPHEFLGAEFLIPDPVERHLTENYGNWRTGALYYDLSYDEPCVAYSRSLQTKLYLAKRMGRSIRRGGRFHSTSPALALAENFGIDHQARFPPCQPSPTNDSPWEPVRGLVVSQFTEISATLARVVDSASGICDQLDARVVSTAEHTEGAFVAECLAAVTEIDEATAEISLAGADRYRFIAIDTTLADAIPSVAVAAAARHRCDIVFFDETTRSLTLIGDRVVTASDSSVVASQRTAP